MYNIMNTKKVLSIGGTIAWILTLILISSCKEDTEELWVGNAFSELNVHVKDPFGNNSVLEWIATSDDLKETTAEYVEIQQNPNQYLSDLHYYWNNDPETAWFRYSIVLDLFSIDDKLSWRFKMYPDDEEEILLEGKCVKDKGNGIRDRCIQWTFRGTELSIENPKKVTLIRTEDGRYTLKQ